MGAIERKPEGTTEESAEESVKELAENSVEVSIEESVEKPIKEPIEGVVEELVEEPAKEPIEEVVEELVEEPAKEPIEEVVEELVEEPVKESIEESGEEVLEELTENPTEDSIEDQAKDTIKKRKKIIMVTITSICALLIIYFIMTNYFTNHFYFGSEINCVNVSGKTLEDVKVVMASELQNYTLNLKERGGKNEKIKASDIGLKYNSDEEFKRLKDSQDPFKWVLAPFTTKDSKMTVGLSYDEKLLKKQIDKLSCFNSDNIVEPKEPSFKYADNNYVIVDELPGTKVDKDVLYSHVVGSILKGESEIDLESSGCYIKPKYNSKSQKIIEIKDTLNKYVSLKVTYTFGQNKETVDGSIINKWLTVDENFRITFNEKKIKDYLNGLSQTYDTIGKTRKFTTSSGETISISGGDYGRAIDKNKEIQSLIEIIKEGKNVTKEPIYSQVSFSNGINDIGNTYVELDIAKQHLWFYKNGSLVVQGDVVTGNVTSNHSTPKGIYRLKYKERNAVLRGADYAAPVNFWMPFNGGIGIHDASWRSVFGGDIYLTSGSHGCVNSPYSLANAIFNNIEVGTPVVCY